MLSNGGLLSNHTPAICCMISNKYRPTTRRAELEQQAPDSLPDSTRSNQGITAARRLRRRSRLGRRSNTLAAAVHPPRRLLTAPAPADFQRFGGGGREEILH